MRILVVEDDDTLAEALVEALVAQHYAVDHAPDGATADDLVSTNPYDLVILDWSIPPPSGIELLDGWRQREIETPVLMLTGRGGLEDRVSGLDCGADDYLTKPFAYAELLARVRSLLRRGERPLPPLAVADVELDPVARQVRVAGEPVTLTPKELGVLEYLLRHPDRPVSREELIEHVWDDAYDAMSNTLDVLVYRLRKKVDRSAEGRLIRTVTGVGYLLASERRPEE